MLNFFNNEIYGGLTKLISTCWRSYRKKISVAVTAMALSSFLEGVGLLSLIPLLQLTEVGGTAAPSSGWLSSLPSFLQIKISLEALLLFYVTLVSVIAIISFFNSKLVNKLQVDFTSEYRLKVYQHYLYANYQTILTMGRSTINNLLTKEVDRVGFAFLMVTRLVASFITVAISIVAACLISWPLTLVALGSGAVLYILLSYQTKQSHKLGKADSALYEKLFKDINDHLNCIKMVKVYGHEKASFERFSGTDASLKQQRSQFGLLRARNTLWYGIGGVICFSLIFYVSSTFLQISLPVLFVLLIIFSRIVPRISGIQHDINYLISSLPAVVIIENNIEKFKLQAAKKISDKGHQSLIMSKVITLKDISFKYSATNKYILEHFNLNIPVNKITAIVGPSGTGKSTLVDILMSLLTPESGTILIDGQPLTADQLSAWQNQLGYVPRDSTIVQDTIRANLLLASPQATEQEIAHVLTITRAVDFINRLPQKLDTLLDDFGNNFSAGEKQRLMLACALLRQPKLLILDEATNSIDTGNEHLIYEALKNLREKVTIILITHNTSHLNWVDQVVDLEKIRLNAAEGKAVSLA